MTLEISKVMRPTSVFSNIDLTFVLHNPCNDFPFMDKISSPGEYGKS